MLFSDVQLNTPTEIFWVPVLIYLFYLSTSFFLKRIGAILRKCKTEHFNQLLKATKFIRLACWLATCIFLFAPLAMMTMYSSLSKTLAIWLISMLVLNKLYQQKLKASILGGFLIAQLPNFAHYTELIYYSFKN